MKKTILLTVTVLAITALLFSLTQPVKADISISSYSNETRTETVTTFPNDIKFYKPDYSSFQIVGYTAPTFSRTLSPVRGLRIYGKSPYIGVMLRRFANEEGGFWGDEIDSYPDPGSTKVPNNWHNPWMGVSVSGISWIPDEGHTCVQSSNFVFINGVQTLVTGERCTPTPQAALDSLLTATRASFGTNHDGSYPGLYKFEGSYDYTEATVPEPSGITGWLVWALLAWPSILARLPSRPEL